MVLVLVMAVAAGRVAIATVRSVGIVGAHLGLKIPYPIVNGAGSRGVQLDNLRQLVIYRACRAVGVVEHQEELRLDRSSAPASAWVVPKTSGGFS